MAKNGESRKRRLKVLLGLAATGGFLLALPAAALACVSAGACTLGGGVVFGVKGYYQQSSEFQVFGGQAYVKFPVLTWLGVQPVMPRN